MDISKGQKWSIYCHIPTVCHGAWFWKVLKVLIKVWTQLCE